MPIQHVTTEQFQKLLETATTPILVDFFATWCGPCRMIAPHLEEIAVERDDVIIVKVNVDEEPGLAQSFGVQVIPTLFTISKGKISAPMTGYRDKAALIKAIDDAK